MEPGGTGQALKFGRSDLEYIFGVAHEMRGMVERVIRAQFEKEGN